MNKKLFCIIGLIGLLAACAPAPETAPKRPESQAVSEAAVEESADAAVSVSPETVDALAAEDALCGTDGKLACPLVKPVENMTVEYDRTPEQEALMEAFDGLSLQDKIAAIDQGLIVCTEFIHDEKWEHEIDPRMAALAGEKAYTEWVAGDNACHSIYHFANAFGLTYSDLEKVIQENSLTAYDLDALKKGMEKWCAE